ncbi:nuclease EXOG, mitochondrial-like [Diadema antillarum]|uniref:nuclease EXOG, mitochondrial-like n=1 Tax=Diadema antillarum TaxID=105358 RepID=UPI003A8695B7
MNTFTRGFASGAAASVAVYALYAALINHNQGHAVFKRSLPSQPAPEVHEDAVRGRLIQGSNIFKYGVPDDGSQPRYYLNHALSYDQTSKIPKWVAEHITAQDLRGDANRKKSNFKMDPNLTPMYSSMNSDYRGSGWSRGHMAPAADCKYSQDAMDETFYLTNILPQDIDNNMNFWNLMEIYCRDLTTTFSEVRVISGPLMVPNVTEDGKKYVKYEVIGNNLVAVPTHLYKVITVEPGNGSETIGVGAFIVPNEAIDSKQRGLKEFQVSLEALEKAAGITFLPNLTRSAAVVDLCSLDSCRLKSKDELDRFFIGKRIANATTLDRLEKSWAELGKRRLEPTENLRNLYAEKKRALEMEDKK